jgi:DNA-binding NarL/FixJ family response regulator
MHSDEVYVTRALQAGATGYMLKDSAGKDLIKGIASVAAGQAYFSPAIARLMLDDYKRRVTGSNVIDRYETLSAREREIFQLIAEARTNKEVAELLEISPATVETHRARILQKLDIHNTAELVLYAVRRGIIS